MYTVWNNVCNLYNNCNIYNQYEELKNQIVTWAKHLLNDNWRLVFIYFFGNLFIFPRTGLYIHDSIYTMFQYTTVTMNKTSWSS